AKQCPICDSNFTTYSQKQFEEHVSGHLATPTKSLASILNTFDVLESPGSEEVLELDNAFNLSPSEIRNREFYLKYSATRDIYIRAGRSGPGFCEVVGWEAGTHQSTDIFRNHELDHEMVYLARKETRSCGSISWLVNWAGISFTPYAITVKLPHTIFNQGKVSWCLKLGDQVLPGYRGGILELSECQIRGHPHSLQVCAELSSDESAQNSSVAWQHAQLFRQKDSDVNHFPFVIHIKFCERSTVVEENHALNMSPEEVRRKEFLLKYSTAKDIYVRPIKSGNQEVRGWLAGVYGVNDMFRKHEHDHKMVYLARKEGANTGTVKWRVNWSGCSIVPKDVIVSLPHTTYYSGKVTWYITIGEQTFPGEQDGYLCLRDLVLGPVSHLDVFAHVEGGSSSTPWGNVAWQHAQLFRQKETDSRYFPFVINILFKDEY
ncbi:unnamed protein product, partial [Meganyctiphanes norvegica]